MLSVNSDTYKNICDNYTSDGKILLCFKQFLIFMLCVNTMMF